VSVTRATRVASVLVLAAACACGCASQAPLVPEGPPPQTKRCPSPSDELAAHAQYERARATIAGCDELCGKTSNGGFRVIRANAELLEAARRGDRDAQALHGKLAFENAYLNGDGQLDEARIVEALAFLRLAMQRGSGLPGEFMPALGKLSLAKNGTLDGVAEAPLGDLPREWLVRAFESAERELACYPKLQPTR
jgi:hypothetical protein